MDRWDKEEVIWAVTSIAVVTAFLFATFATTQYVDAKHEGVMDVLNEIRSDVRDIRNYQLEQSK